MQYQLGFGTAEAARRTGKSQRSIQRAVAAGELTAYVMGRRSITIFEEDLDAWIGAHRVVPAHAEEVV